MAVRGGIGEWRVAGGVVALVASTVACTQVAAPDLSEASETEAVTGAATVKSVAPATSVVHTMLPSAPAAVSSTSAPVTTAVTVATTPPTFAQQFASALAPIQVDVLGTPVSVPARDSVARLWLLVGRPPTDHELQTAVPAVVRDGVPLDALATMLLHSPDGAVAEPDAPADVFVAALYEGVLGRKGKPGELAAWVQGIGRGMSPGDIAVVLAESPEAVRRTGTVAHEPLPATALEDVPRSVSDSVLRLYLGLLVRLPTAGELDHDVDRYTGGESLGAIADDIVRSAEYRARRPDGDPASVLAGLFADVLGAHPSDAVVAGWGDHLSDAASAGHVAAAFTESAVAVTRTRTTSPAPSLGSSRPAGGAVTGTDILAVGDSIMLGAADALAEQFPGIAVDAAVGRQFSKGVSIIRSLSKVGAIPGTVIIHLGTNGTVTRESCDDMMSLLVGKRVVLVNVHVPRPWEAATNDVLAACAARHGAGIVDWHRNASGLAPDGYHLGGSGAAAFATLIASAV